MSQPDLNVSVTRRYFLRGLGLLSGSAALAACAQPSSSGSVAAQTQKAAPMLAIIHTNDTHGHDVEVQATEDDEGNFSMAAVAALKADWEAKGYEVMLVDAGDATQGMPLVDTEKGATAIAFMNSCGYDLMAVGNHEFDWGPENLEKIEQAAKFPLLSANVLMEGTGKPRFTPNKVMELADGTKVGFFGLTTPATQTTTRPTNIEQFTFLTEDDLVKCAQEQVDELRGQGCDLVVCVGHLGNDEPGHSNSKDVIEGVKGIDLFIDGHDHAQVSEEVAGTLLVETGCFMHNIGVVTIDQGAPASEPVAYGSYDGIDKATQAVIDEANNRIEQQMAVVLGKTDFLLDGNRSPGLRTQETNLGDFCADAYQWAAEQYLGTKIDGAIVNGGGLRTSIEAGDITLKTIKAVMPFANETAIIEVSGAQLLEALEAGTQQIGGEGKALGGFPQVAGIKYKIDAKVPFEEGPLYPDSSYHSPAKVGARVTVEEVGGRPFSEDETYTLATNIFVAEGGDTYYAFKVAAEQKAPVLFGFDYEAFASYLTVKCDHKVPDTYRESQGRITIVGA